MDQTDTNPTPADGRALDPARWGISPGPYHFVGRRVIQDDEGQPIARVNDYCGNVPLPLDPNGALFAASWRMLGFLVGLLHAIETAPHQAVVIPEGSEQHLELIEIIGEAGGSTR